ncbi:DUF6226 family protein [Microbacterium ulmi]|uniref:Uncharacterized protein n=1 Tax=Microbacterium ulmi TaxID=179095 RepID=A0A7Y2Q2Q7_9MICO|nr:DUF6226 family protein [Microbacterium ulmi]NII69496.1 hypothetical protein [Microbacterium ulmi]NNH04903.1 hypothetical protein [Microbacterium ulmi]
MAGYRRPGIASVTPLDAGGHPIPYGDRWGQDGPPEESYSRTSNLDRFAPPHTVADALIAWLADEFVVTVTRDARLGADLMRARDDIVDAVRIVPDAQDAASLTVVFTSFPSVIVHAGVLHDFLFPVCGCDACDETWDRRADELEWTVRTVASGGYSEWIRHDRELGAGFRLDEPGVGGRSGEGRVVDISLERLSAAEPKLAALAGAWRAWPRRATDG